MRPSFFSYLFTTMVCCCCFLLLFFVDFISKYVTYIFNTKPTASVTKQEASVKYSSN